MRSYDEEIDRLVGAYVEGRNVTSVRIRKDGLVEARTVPSILPLSGFTSSILYPMLAPPSGLLGMLADFERDKHRLTGITVTPDTYYKTGVTR